MNQYNQSRRLIAAQFVEDAPWPFLPIIGIAGHARSGKDTVAQFIRQEYQCMQYAFAEPLKNMLKAIGLEEHELNGWRKDETNNDFQSTPRHMMQTLGTEWGRDTINDNIWVIAAEKRLKHMHSINPAATILITDVRFQNEADFVRKHGFLIHMHRSIKRIDGSIHRSENPLSVKSTDHIIINDGDLDQLREEALRIAMQISIDVQKQLGERHAS